MNAFGAFSYGAAAVAFLALTLLLATSWRGRAQGGRLIAAATVTAVWAAGLAWQAWFRTMPLIGVYTLEVLRAGAWIVVLVGLAQGVLPRLLAMACNVLWVGLLVAGWVLAVLQARLLASDGPGLLLAPGGLAIALTVLVLLEQVYRNANASGRFAFKFLAIGLGGVFAYDLFMFSQAELLRTISEEAWLARGIVNALLVPLIAVAARRNPEWSLDVFISRQVVVFTTAVMAVGVYLLVMAAGGYLVRQFGGSWGSAANIIFLAGALIVLATIVMSGTVRRRLKVFVSKHFYRNKYDYRIEWLRFVETLSSGNEEDMRRTSLQAIAQIFDSPGAVMYWRGEVQSDFAPVAAWPMSAASLSDLGPVPVDHEMMHFIGQRHWVVDLREHEQSPELYQNAALPEGLQRQERIRVLLPLLRSDGLGGFVLLFEPPPPFDLTWEDRDLLKTVGRHVASIVAQHEADQRLAESRQFEAYHRLTAFLMHDLKNSVAQLQLVVRNAEKHRHNPDFVDDAMDTIGNAVQRMQRLIDQLGNRGRSQAVEPVDLVALLRGAASRCSDRSPVIDLKGSWEGHLMVNADPDRLAAAVEHVLRNAQDACGSDGSVAVSLAFRDGRACISVADTGAGMPREFIRERLFRPFDSTKGSKGMGIGAFQVREYVRSLGGDVEVQSSPGAGTRFDILIPQQGGYDG